MVVVVSTGVTGRGRGGRIAGNSYKDTYQWVVEGIGLELCIGKGKYHL